MFNLEFFKGKIDTSETHNLPPPIDPEVVDSINGEIKENNQNDSELSKIDDEPKFYKYQILHDGTAYEGEWLNYQRHGKGTLFKHSTNNTPLKIYEGEWRNDKRWGEGIEFEISTDNTPVITYQGQWKNDKRDGYGTSFKICNDNTSVKVYQGEWSFNRYDRKGTFFDGDDSLAVESEYNESTFEY